MSSPQQGFRLSPQQTAIWLCQHRYGTTFTCSCTVEIKGALQSGRLKTALERVVARQEILRTSFHARRGVKTPLQVIADVNSLDFRSFDVTHLSGERQSSELNRIVAEEVARPFDFASGPVLRAALACLSPERHELLLTAPTMCADGRTLRNLVAELGLFYADPSATDDEVLQYADFAEWQNTLLESEDEDARAARAFWEKNSPRRMPVSLPLERSDDGRFAPSSLNIPISPELAKSVEAQAHKKGVSIGAFARAAWQALLWRLSQQPAFVTYEMADGRHPDDVAAAFGPYAKWLPIHWEFEVDGPRFDEFLRDSQTRVQRALEWQDYVALVPSGSAPEAETSRIAFEYLEGEQDVPAGDVSLSVVNERTSVQPWKAKLTVIRASGSWDAELQYNATLLDEGNAKRLAGYFVSLLRSAVENPSERIGRLNLLDEVERRRLLIEFNATSDAYPSDSSIHQLFEQQVERTPEAPAVKFGTQVLSYRELNSRADALAAVLRESDVAADVQVGLLLPRSAESVIAILSTLKAGGAYVPLNPADPPERLRHQIAAAKVVVTSSELADKVHSDFAGKVICLDQQQRIDAASPGQSRSAQTGSSDDLAYVIFTSGSTGVPKGVGISHRALVNYATFIQRKLSTAEPMRFATVSPFSTDLGNTCIFPALISGGCLDMVDLELARDADALARYFAESPADVLKIVPSHLSAMLEAADCQQILPRRFLILGGETFSWDLLRRLEAIPHTCRIINHYGPTETTVGVLTFDVEPVKSARTVPVGRPIANAEAYILDKNLEPVPVGVAGELYLSGAGLARGYVSQPEQTAERFVRHPFSSDPNARLYRTGDLARHLAEGYIEFLGRTDHQVKVRGFRIELAEIESVLLGHPTIRDCVVVAREQGDDKRLVAYFTTSQPLDAAQLRAWLGERLPEHMMPSAFVPLAKLPLAPSGKVDRATLPDPEVAAQQAAFVPPRTDLEREVAKIWAALLNLENVSVEANFFDLGGHSLLATQLVSRLRKEFSVELPLRSVFEFPTVGGISKTIEDLRAQKLTAAFSEIESMSDEEAERLLAEATRNPGETE